MTNSLLKTLCSLLLLLIFNSVDSQTAVWKHYEYHDLNLQFDLPADYVFKYPDDSRLAFSGHNNLTTFYFERIDRTITNQEQRKQALYSFDKSGNNQDEDPNFQSGVTATGYLSAGTVVLVNDINETAIAMVMSDPNNNRLNFYIFVTYGGEGNEDSPAFDQARTILLKFGPIIK